MSPCFPRSLSISALHYTPSPCRAGVCIVTDNHVQEFETCIKNFRGIHTIIRGCWFQFSSRKKKRQINCLMSMHSDRKSNGRIFEECVGEIYMHGKTTGFSCSYWAIFHPVLMQYLRLVQVFFNLTFALITSPVTHRRAELSSPTLNQHKLKYTPYSTVTYVHLFACFLKKMVKLKKMQNAL